MVTKQHLRLTKRLDCWLIEVVGTTSNHGLSLDDIVNLTPKFWDVWIDAAVARNGAATSLFAIQSNLVLGTLGPLVDFRPELKMIVDDLLTYKAIGQFCLTEVGHGLDAAQLETIVTSTREGKFLLNTPNASAAKYMPPTVPVLGKPCYAIVFARLVVDGTDNGIKAFLVQLNDGHTMSPGIICKRLPYRGNAAPLNHSITSFHQVLLPADSLLSDPRAPKIPRIDFLLSIWRVAVGTLSVGIMAIPALQIAAYITYKYSLRRKVSTPSGSSVSIFSFRTQQLPIFYAVAQAFVFKAFSEFATTQFSNKELEFRVRHGIATCFKTVAIRAALTRQESLSERCGVQGLFNYNHTSLCHANTRGAAIAEGDILVLCIRLASELIQGRYSLPGYKHEGLLAKYADGLLTTYQNIWQEQGGRAHPDFANMILPQAQTLVSAIGHSMAYNAAVKAGVDQKLLDLYECAVIREDLAWFVGEKLVSYYSFQEQENRAITAAQSGIDGWINGMNVSEAVNVPIVDDAKWAEFVDGLPEAPHSV
ncbi:hypothetical protein D9758_014146 [Tetrapyrgos nigripes]|uniref:Acyl-CoA oxidase C-alpha1 domain-containing protein n=1 Tax=Tetrapyrgos nigripes TaxID=182062 RepID=A0A8H5FP68_9AGAR|nr:hypothetical protein D9758_014146 [Tetrapyrgos nigripes]